MTKRAATMRRRAMMATPAPTVGERACFPISMILDARCRAIFILASRLRLPQEIQRSLLFFHFLEPRKLQIYIDCLGRASTFSSNSFTLLMTPFTRPGRHEVSCRSGRTAHIRPTTIAGFSISHACRWLEHVIFADSGKRISRRGNASAIRCRRA